MPAITEQQRKQIEAFFVAIAAIAEAIRDLGEVPAGHLYARVCHRMDLETFESILRILCSQEQGPPLVTRDPSHLLRWTGPAKPENN